MPGLLERSLDRELGPPTAAERRRAAGGSWLPDWHLLLGLVLSACLIAASTLAGGEPPRPKTSLDGAQAAGGPGDIPGSVVDVGEGDSSQPQAGGPGKATTGTHSTAPASSSGTHAKKSHHASASPSATPSDASGTPASGTSSSGSSGSSRHRSSSGSRTPSGGRTSSPTAPATPGRIVNVTGTSASFTNGPMSYAFSAPTHVPVVGKRWRLQISAKRSGVPLAGSVKIDILHNGAVVGHAASGKLQSGRFAHDFDWPDKSVGYPLTVKTTIVGGGFQQSFLFNVKVAAGSG
jgi:hypothetical protein